MLSKHVQFTIKKWDFRLRGKVESESGKEVGYFICNVCGQLNEKNNNHTLEVFGYYVAKSSHCRSCYMKLLRLKDCFKDFFTYGDEIVITKQARNFPSHARNDDKHFCLLNQQQEQVLTDICVRLYLY